ncbi:YihY/virulence factor BrkB family protein, partial [Candidatus Latescibacterota bacterium]
LVKSTYQEWLKQKPALLGAAIAFYFIFSLGPILVITVGAVGLIFGKQAAEGQIVQEIYSIIGQKPAEVIQSFIIQASSPPTRILTTILSIPTVLLGSIMIFIQLKNTLNIIWDVKPPNKKRFNYYLLNYGLLFLIVVLIGILLILLIIKSFLLAIFSDFVGQFLPFHIFFLLMIDLIITFCFTTVLFAVLYKILPDIYIKWSNIWIGALVTSFMFAIGQLLIGLYISKTDIDTAYGALGSLTVLLIWIFYSSLIFLAGAIFTKVYSQKNT